MHVEERLRLGKRPRRGRFAFIRLLLLCVLLHPELKPCIAAGSPTPPADHEFLVRLDGVGESILPVWRSGGPDAPRLFCLEDLLRLETLMVDHDGLLWTIWGRGHKLRLAEGARFVHLDKATLALALPPLRVPEGLLLDLRLLEAMLDSGLLEGALDYKAESLSLETLSSSLVRETLAGGEVLRLRMPEIPVFESKPDLSVLELHLPALEALKQLVVPDQLASSPGRLIRSISISASVDDWILRLSLSQEAELVDVEEVEGLGEIQVLLRRRGAAQLAEPLREPEPEEILANVPGRGLREPLQRLVIDAGHGGHDPGAVSRWGRSEKDMTLAIALDLRDELKKQLPDLEVLLTRDRDEYLSLTERTRRANQARGQVFISLHANAAKDRRARGHEIFFLRPGRNEHAREVALRENSVLEFDGQDGSGHRPTSDWILASMAQSAWAEESRALAAMISHGLAPVSVKRRRPVLQAGFQVLIGASMPAVLVECGFLTNAEDHRLLSSRTGQQSLARALAGSIVELHALSRGGTQ